MIELETEMGRDRYVQRESDRERERTTRQIYSLAGHQRIHRRRPEPSAKETAVDKFGFSRECLVGGVGKGWDG